MHISIPKYLFRRNENIYQQKDLYKNIHNSFIHIRPKIGKKHTHVYQAHK